METGTIRVKRRTCTVSGRRSRTVSRSCHRSRGVEPSSRRRRRVRVRACRTPVWRQCDVAESRSVGHDTGSRWSSRCPAETTSVTIQAATLCTIFLQRRDNVDRQSVHNARGVAYIRFQRSTHVGQYWFWKTKTIGCSSK